MMFLRHRVPKEIKPCGDIFYDVIDASVLTKGTDLQ